MMCHSSFLPCCLEAANKVWGGQPHGVVLLRPEGVAEPVPRVHPEDGVVGVGKVHAPRQVEVASGRHQGRAVGLRRQGALAPAVHPR